MQRVLILALTLLVATTAGASVSAERPLTAAVSQTWTDFDGVYAGNAFVIAWGHPSSTNRGTWFARVNLEGQLVSGPTRLSFAEPASAPAVANAGDYNLITWWEHAGIANVVRLQYVWLDRDGNTETAVSTLTESTLGPAQFPFPQVTLSVDAVGSAASTLVAFGDDDNLRTALFIPGTTNFTTRLVSRDVTARIRLVQNGAATLLLSDHLSVEFCPIPEGCLATEIRARVIDSGGAPASLDFVVAGRSLLDAVAFGNEFAIATAHPFANEFAVQRIDIAGNVLALANRELSSDPSLAEFGNELLTGFERSANLYFTPLGLDLSPTGGLLDQQAYTISHAVDRDEFNLHLVRGPSRVLAVYVSQLLSEPRESYAAVRVIDPTTLPPLPPRPPRPRVISASSNFPNTFAASVVLRWTEVPGTWLYHVIADPVDENIPAREIVVDPLNTTAVFTDLNPSTLYEFQLVVERGEGLSPESDGVLFTTPPWAPPAERRRAVRPQR